MTNCREASSDFGDERRETVTNCREASSEIMTNPRDASSDVGHERGEAVTSCLKAISEIGHEQKIQWWRRKEKVIEKESDQQR